MFFRGENGPLALNPDYIVEIKKLNDCNIVLMSSGKKYKVEYNTEVEMLSPKYAFSYVQTDRKK